MVGHQEKKPKARTRETDKLVLLNPDNPEACKRNLYYWWWIYLRENKDYEKTCANGGEGRFGKLYKDFGDIHATNFAAWWKDKMWMLFGEPWQRSVVKQLKGQLQKFLDEEDNLDGEIWIDLKIPLHVSGHRVAVLLEGLMEREQKGLGIDTDNVNCEPKYNLAGSAQPKKLDVDLKILNSKKVSYFQDWKIGVEFGLSPGLSPDQPPDERQKHGLRHTVWGRRRRASDRIEGAARGDFPGKNPRKVSGNPFSS